MADQSKERNDAIESKVEVEGAETTSESQKSEEIENTKDQGEFEDKEQKLHSLEDNVIEKNPPKRVCLGGRLINDETDIFSQNAWDHVEWTEERLTDAKVKVDAQAAAPVSGDDVLKFKEQAGAMWNKFYDAHQNRFFKDRNWLFLNFPELEKLQTEEPFRVFEIGCGVGNTVIPLLKSNPNPNLYVYGCDISSTAVKILEDSDDRDKTRSTVFVHDISTKEPNQVDDNETVPYIKDGSLDICTLIYVLSAISPENMQHVIDKIAKLLKPGGVLLIRDYGRYDLAQLRFKKNRYMEENLYARGDGTMVYFFSKEEISEMMTQAGLEQTQLEFDQKLIVNRKTQQKMYRVWLQCKFKKPL